MRILLTNDWVLHAILLAVGLAAGFLVGWRVAPARTPARRAVVPEAGRPEDAAMLRRMRAAAQDLRVVGMTLHGQATQLHASAAGPANAIGRAASDVFGVADDLHQYALHGGGQVVISDEEVDLTVAVNDAIASVSGALAPGLREWRVSADMPVTKLIADRRALRHVLTRVLTTAARHTGEGEPIDVALQARGDAVALVIEGYGGEGAGAEPEDGPRGLELARSLMTAHGGQLELQVLAGEGTRLSLLFPAQRVRATVARVVK